MLERQYQLSERALDLFLERALRLARISERIRLAGREICGDQVAPVLGLVLATRRELPAAFHAPVRDRFGLDGRPRVLAVVPGHAAARAGLRAGDVIHRVDGEPVPSAAWLRRFRRAPGSDGPLEVRVLRDGSPLDLRVPYTPGCRSAARVVIRDGVYAFNDGEISVFFTGFLRYFPDDAQLALVVGHELAHGVLQHRGSQPDREAEADYMGTYLSARAGFDVSEAVAFWGRYSELSVYTVTRRAGSSHPSFPGRMLALEATVAEIAAKLARGAPLEPNPL